MLRRNVLAANMLIFTECLHYATGFPGSSVGKESACNAGDSSLIPGLGRSPGEGKKLLTPVFWPGELPGRYNPWSHKELDRTKQLSLSFPFPMATLSALCWVLWAWQSEDRKSTRLNSSLLHLLYWQADS